MKIKFLVLFLAAGLLFGQEEKKDDSKNVELPDFVITGVQSLNIPERDKNKPELTTTLSEEFFKPLKTPRKISSSSISSPVQHPIDIFENSNRKNNRLYLGAGIQTIPVGRLNMSNAFKHYLFTAEVFGSEEHEFVDYAGYNVSGAAVTNDFFISDLSDFMPGTKISLDGKYVRDSYHFFASNIPQTKRETHLGKAELSVLNEYAENLNYGAVFSGRTYLLKDAGITENLFDAKAFTKFNFNKLKLRLEGNYKKQMFEDPNLPSSDYIAGKIRLKATPSREINVEAGFKYINQDTNSYVIPYAKIMGRLDDNIYIYAEYAPYPEFLTKYDFVQRNKYFNEGSISNLVVDNKVQTKVAFKYQLDNIFETSAGLEIMRSDNYPYFTDNNNPGFFDVKTLNDVKTFTFFANVMLLKSPYGYFYGDIQYSETRDASRNFIPYHPLFEASLTYGYSFSFDLNAEVKLDYAREFYTNIANSYSYDDYLNASLGLEYEFTKNIWFNLDLHNLFNRANNFYLSYKEKPFDVIGGVKYHW